MFACFSALLLATSSAAAWPTGTARGTQGVPPVAPAMKPVVWTIAGSDSGGGAGIQADLHAMHALGVHGCSVITALTAQNSLAVTRVEYASPEMIRATIDALAEDMPPAAVKLGMMGTADAVAVVGDFLDGYGGKVVCDPVMVSTSGSKLMTGEARAAMLERVFPRADMITPNRLEAEELLGRTLRTPAEVEAGAAELLAMSGAKSVLIKGGHAGDDSVGSSGDPPPLPTPSPATATTSSSPPDYPPLLSQDYWTDGDPENACWLTGPRVDSRDTHGTGCTLSSAAASCLALGLGPLDAAVVAKAYVTQGIRAGAGRGPGKGPGPVAHTGWPSWGDCFPWVTPTAAAGQEGTGGGGEGEGGSRLRFLPCHREWGLYAVVDSAEWVERLVALGVRDIQLRVKGEPSPEALDAEVAAAAAACRRGTGGEKGEGPEARGAARLWVNDHWRLAAKHSAYGVHLGQEDMAAAGGPAGLAAAAAAGLRLGVSTHSYAELARALAARPSYVSLGPVFATRSKDVGFGPQGLEGVRAWRALLDGAGAGGGGDSNLPGQGDSSSGFGRPGGGGAAGPRGGETGTPLVAIGGITLQSAPEVLAAGAEGLAVIAAITKAEDVAAEVACWEDMFARARGASRAGSQADSG